MFFFICKQFIIKKKWTCSTFEINGSYFSTKAYIFIDSTKSEIFIIIDCTKSTFAQRRISNINSNPLAKVRNINVPKFFKPWRLNRSRPLAHHFKYNVTDRESRFGRWYRQYRSERNRRPSLWNNKTQAQRSESDFTRSWADREPTF